MGKRHKDPLGQRNGIEEHGSIRNCGPIAREDRMESLFVPNDALGFSPPSVQLKMVILINGLLQHMQHKLRCELVIKS